MARIAVVDDENTVRNMLMSALDDAGYLAEGFHSFDYFAEHRKGAYDVIVLDENMPGTPGSDGLIRMREEGDDTPVLLIGSNIVEDGVVGKTADCEDVFYLPKTFRTSTFYKHIQGIISQTDKPKGPE